MCLGSSPLTRSSSSCYPRGPHRSKSRPLQRTKRVMCRAHQEANHLCHRSTRLLRHPGAMPCRLVLEDLRQRTRRHSSVLCYNCLRPRRQAPWAVAAPLFRSNRRHNCTAHRRSSPHHLECATMGAR